MERTCTHSVSWQNPFVDIFRHYGLWNPGYSAKKGTVFEDHDTYIGRSVFRINGQVSTANLITIPEKQDKSLGIEGRFGYLQFLPQDKKFFHMHFDFIMLDNSVIRISVSNMYKQQKTSGMTVQIPAKVCETPIWGTFIVDFENILRNSGLHSKSRTYKHVLRQIQVCSNMSVRSIYTSDNLYNEKTFPKEMCFKLPSQKQTYLDQYKIYYYPENLSELYQKEKKLQNELQTQKDGITIKKEQVQEKLEKQNLVKQQLKQLEVHQSLPLQDEIEEIKLVQGSTMKESLNHKDNISLLKQESLKAQNPQLKLIKCQGFSGMECPDIKFTPQNTLFFSSGSTLVEANIHDKTQNLLIGHSSQIQCLDISKNGQFIASAQIGPNSQIKIWDRQDNLCIFSWVTEYQMMQSLSFSNNGDLLCSVGKDERNREIMVVWDLTQKDKQHRPLLLAKQTSEFNILCAKFSPYEIDKIVCCGKENIRFLRIKKGFLPGCAVVLNHYARNSIFTALDFEFNNDQVVTYTDQIRRVFVGSKLGLLFQINYFTRELEGVFKVHDSSICSIRVSAGFCVTGSEDQFLRVWPLDFSEFFLEAKHEGLVLSLDISQDALQVACGSSKGGLGIMDLSAQSYRTVLRSHNEIIKQIEYHKFSQSIITLSTDLTIRVWDIQNFDQQYEFSYPKDDNCLFIVSNPNQDQFIGGFQSGSLRVFDIQNTCILYEKRFHKKPIKNLSFSKDGQVLSVVDETCMYYLCDANKKFEPFKMLQQETPSNYPQTIFANDYFLTVGDSAQCINVYLLNSLTLILKFQVQSSIKKMNLSEDQKEIIVVTQDCKLKIFGVSHNEDYFSVFALKDIPVMHREQMNDAKLSNDDQFIISVGNDKILKVWDKDYKLKTPQIYTSHISEIQSLVIVDDYLITCGGQEGFYIWKYNQQQIQKEEKDFSNLVPIATKFFNTNMQNKSKLSQVVEMKSFNLQDDDIQQDFINEPVQKNQKQLVTSSQFKPINIKYSKQKIFRQSRMTLQQDLNENSIKQQEFQSDYDINQKIHQIQQNSQKMQIQYLTSFNNKTHNNVIWNEDNGYVAYTVQNMIIFEQFSRNKKQRIATFSEEITCITSNKEQSIIFVGAATLNQEKQKTNIYMLSTESLRIVLSYHTESIQCMSVSQDGKYLISISIDKQICVWDVIMRQLISSTINSDEINDVLINPFDQDDKLSFVTVGNNQIYFYAFEPDNQLQYYDVNIQNQATCCEYIYINDQEYLISGCQKGQIIVYDKNYQLVFEKKVCWQEISHIICKDNRIFIFSQDGYLYINDYIEQIQDLENLRKYRYGFQPNSVNLNKQMNEFIAGSIDGSIYYVNINENVVQQVISGTYNMIKLLYLNENFYVTSHKNGSLKIWNQHCGELIHVYDFKFIVTQIKHLQYNQYLCFSDNLQEIKQIDLEKIGFYQNFRADIQKSDEFILLIMNDLIFTNKGSVFQYLLNEDILELNKIFQNENTEISTIKQISDCKVCFGLKQGIINVYEIIKNEFYLIDEFDLLNQIQQSDQIKDIQQEKYNIEVLPSGENKYFAFISDFSVIYERDHINKNINNTINLSSEPICFNKIQSSIIIGLKDSMINIYDCGEMFQFRQLLNEPINQILIIDDYVMCGNQQGLIKFSIN